MFQKALAGVLVAVVLAIGTLSCTGPTGPAGPAGESAEAGAVTGAMGLPGITGPQGPPGTGVAGGDAGVVLPVGCLSPCHGFNGVITQYQSSVHYSTFITNVGGDEATAWTTPGSVCGNCHAIDGVALRVAGKVGTTDGGVVEHLGNGQILYRNPPDAGVSTESTYAGGALVAKVDCTTCHAVTNANDPHKTGIPWTDGSFPFVVPSGATDVSYIEKTQPGSTTTGTVVPGLLNTTGSQGPGNACVFCHKSRKDVTTYVTASNKITSLNWGPHEGPQADVFSGMGGYSYAGKTYGQSTHQAKLQCIDCHMPPVANNSKVPDHLFAPRLSACIGCHATAVNFDVNGGQSLVRASLTELRTVLNNAGALTQTATAPYLALPASVIADPAADMTLDKARPNGAADGGATVLAADQAGALYNYFLIARGGAMGVHNTKYTQQIVYDSIVAMGASPVAIALRPQ